MPLHECAGYVEKSSLWIKNKGPIPQNMQICKDNELFCYFIGYRKQIIAIQNTVKLGCNKQLGTGHFCLLQP
jgi:hypothetical protein